MTDTKAPPRLYQSCGVTSSSLNPHVVLRHAAAAWPLSSPLQLCALSSTISTPPPVLTTRGMMLFAYGLMASGSLQTSSDSACSVCCAT